MSFYSSLTSFNFTHLPAAGKTTNLGDDIQVECAARLWHTRQFVERDDFNTWKSDMIIPFLGWYGYDLWNHPPKANCVLVSFHLCHDMMKHISKNPKFVDWMKYNVTQQGFPAMARDTATMDFVRNLGVDCEFGGCVTQTLPVYEGARSGIVGIDAPQDITDIWDTNLPQIYQTLPHLSYEQRLKIASERIKLYSSSEHVYTTRLHVYLPCKALGTPVTFYKSNIFQPHRLSGLID